MSAEGIEVEGGTVFHGEKAVLDNVNLSFEAHRTTVLLGASGCGKSVLLKTAAGLLQPFAGHILIDGCDLSTMSERENRRFRQASGFVFQDAALWANSTLFQNMSLPLRVHFPAMSERQISERIEHLLTRVGFSENLTLRPADAAAGERKIVSFIRALVTDPRILFMDEPIAGIHHQVSERIIEVIRDLKRGGRTIIIATHDPILTSQLADSLVVMQNGRVLEAGPVAEVARSRNPDVIAILTRVLSQASTFDGSILDILDSGSGL
jgi:phospholipid/cholesterol/gamma-HCH transport system ATP-binding protein